MTGAHSEMRHFEADPNDVSSHGSPTVWKPVDLQSAKERTSSAPTSQMFSEGNGGESRKSFHGYPNGFAQVHAPIRSYLIQNATLPQLAPPHLTHPNPPCPPRPSSSTLRPHGTSLQCKLTRDAATAASRRTR